MSTRVSACGEENAVNIESAVMVVISLLLTVYLVWALLRPEDF
jgi:K+-transporting ATPase KdpF subunit